VGVARPPLGPDDRTILLAAATRRLGVTRSTLHERVKATNPSIRGLAPGSDLNPGGRWLVSLDDVEAEERRKGLVDHPAPPPADLSVDAMRVEMLQGALTDAQQALVAQAETLVAELRARLADRDRALAEKDARIAQLERQLAAATRHTADLLAVAGA
jgi:hypothetical protein